MTILPAPVPREIRSEIREALSVLLDPDATVELRIPNTTKGTVSGYFTDHDAMADWAAAYSGSVPGIYATLNPVNPDLLARSANRMTAFARHTTGDADILRRRWLLIDMDPVRPAGISSTEDEHQLALDRARAARDWLRAQGWTGLVLGDSGNGAHLLVRVDLPNDAASLTLVKQCLSALAFRFSDERVVVDETTGNAARLVKVYGTRCCKGDQLPDRPHRLAHILEVDENLR